MKLSQSFLSLGRDVVYIFSQEGHLSIRAHPKDQISHLRSTGLGISWVQDDRVELTMEKTFKILMFYWQFVVGGKGESMNVVSIVM